jgi:hypothetical protein
MSESVFPLNIADKEDHPDKIALLEGLLGKYFESAAEVNKKTRALEELFLKYQSLTGGFQNSISSSETPANNGLYAPEDEATYANFGDLVYSPSTTDKGFLVFFIKKNAEYSKIRIDLNIIPATVISENNTDLVPSGLLWVLKEAIDEALGEKLNTDDVAVLGSTNIDDENQSLFPLMSVVKAEQTARINAEFLSLQNYPCFVLNKEADFNDLISTYPLSSVQKGQVYQSVKSLKLYGFDKTKPHRVRAIWNNEADTNFRFIIGELTGVTWVDVFDSTSTPMVDLGLPIDSVGVYEEEINGKKVIAEIDFRLIPLDNKSTLETNTTLMLISERCFFENPVDLTIVNEDIKKLDKQLNGEFEDIKSGVTDGLVGSDGDFQGSGAYESTEFEAVSEGDVIVVTAAGSTGVLLLSAYSSNTQESFLSGNAINEIGGAVSTNSSTFTKVIPSGVNFIRTTSNKTPSLPYTVYKKISDGLADDITLTKNYSNQKEKLFSTRKATFSFIFDDANDSDSLVYDIFKEYGYKPSFALITNSLTSDKIKLYQKFYRNGCSILSHSTDNSVSDLRMKNSKIALVSNFFNINGWVTPSSVLDPSLIPNVKKYYAYAFTQSPPAQNVYPTVSDYNETANPCELGRVGLETWNKDDTGQVNLKALIDYAIDNKLFINFYGHNMPSTYLNTDGVTSRFTQDDLIGLLDYIQEKEQSGLCYVLSTDDALRSYYIPPIY